MGWSQACVPCRSPGMLCWVGHSWRSSGPPSPYSDIRGAGAMMQTHGRAAPEEGEKKTRTPETAAAHRPRAAALHPQNCSLHVDAALPENSQEKGTIWNRIYIFQDPKKSQGNPGKFRGARTHRESLSCMVLRGEQFAHIPDLCHCSCVGPTTPTASAWGV